MKTAAAWASGFAGHDTPLEMCPLTLDSNAEINTFGLERVVKNFAQVLGCDLTGMKVGLCEEGRNAWLSSGFSS